MWCSARVGCSVVSLVAVLFLFNHSVLAQGSDLKQRTGAYVVVPATSGANAASFLSEKSSKLNARNKRIEKQIGRALVIGPRTAAAHADGSDDFVEVNPQEALEFCQSAQEIFGALESCEPDYQYTISATPNDPQLSGLWGMSAIDAAGAWDVSSGSSEVVVAVIDTGIDYTHPDLSNNVWTNPGEIAGNGIDDDGNGYVDDVYGINAAAHSGNPYDDNGHGTHVSGTIGASGNNGYGVVGVNWNVKIMGLKFLTASGSGSLSGAIEAIDYMVAMKNRGVNVRVSNNSWGGGGYSQALFNAIARARDAGIIFVAAAGNEANDNDARPSYPGSYDLSNVVSVAAVDSDLNLAYFSNYGAQNVDIAAPGVSILSTYPGVTFSKLSGTSMATPHVTGSLALLLASEPSLSNDAATARLYDSAVPVASLTGVVRTGRFLNVGRMLKGQTDPIPAPAPAPAPCSYSVSVSNAAPDTSADQGTELFTNADEFNFTKLSLPFPVSFDNQLATSLTVSPNGLVYVGATPSTMDYETARNLPNSSVGFWADLVSTARVAYGPESVTLNWNSYYYGNPGAGTVVSRVRFESSGAIHTWLEFSGSSIQKLITSQMTAGLSGRAYSTTYARNDTKALKNGLALTYTPQCGGTSDGQVQPVKKVTLSSLGGSKAINGRFLVSLISSNGATGSAELGFAFGSKQCSTKAQISVVKEKTRVRGKVPRSLVRRFNKMRVSAGTARSARPLDDATSSRVNRKQSLTEDQFEAMCGQLVNSLKISN